MNECIAKLANQSGFDVDATGKFGNYSEMHRLKKFAELIVRECLDIVDDEGCGEGGSIRAINKIKQHFGVDNNSAQ